jgi:hypothetical protein
MPTKSQSGRVVEPTEVFLSNKRVISYILAVIRRIKFSRAEKLKQCFIVTVLLLALAPIITMTWYVTTSGGANFQDDYAFYIPSLVHMWNNGISYTSIVNGALHGPHFTALPLLIRAIAMKAGHWDAFLEVYISLAIGLGRVALIYGIFAIFLQSTAVRLTILLVASFFVFAPGQLGIFAYGDTGLRACLVSSQ